jgi:hypothetical protein
VDCVGKLQQNPHFPHHASLTLKPPEDVEFYFEVHEYSCIYTLIREVQVEPARLVYFKRGNVMKVVPTPHHTTPHHTTTTPQHRNLGVLPGRHPVLRVQRAVRQVRILHCRVGSCTQRILGVGSEQRLIHHVHHLQRCNMIKRQQRQSRYNRKAYY